MASKWWAGIVVFSQVISYPFHVYGGNEEPAIDAAAIQNAVDRIEKFKTYRTLIQGIFASDLHAQKFLMKKLAIDLDQNPPKVIQSGPAKMTVIQDNKAIFDIEFPDADKGTIRLNNQEVPFAYEKIEVRWENIARALPKRHLYGFFDLLVLDANAQPAQVLGLVGIVALAGTALYMGIQPRRIEKRIQKCEKLKAETKYRAPNPNQTDVLELEREIEDLKIFQIGGSEVLAACVAELKILLTQQKMRIKSHENKSKRGG